MKTAEQQETLKTKRTDILNVDPRNIIIEEGFNVEGRTDDKEKIRELMLSILGVGQLEPLMGFKVKGEDKYILTDGHRRMAAVNMAIAEGNEIPYVKLLPSSGNLEDRLFALVITGIGKEPLSPIGEGETYKKLINLGYNAKEISEKVGKSLPHVYNMLKLADAPKAVKNSILKNEISSTTVMQMLRTVKNSEDLVQTVNNAVQTVKEKTGDSNKPVKVTAKDFVKLKTPIQKLTEALQKSDNEKGSDFLTSLINELNNKQSTPESINSIINKLF